MSETMQVTAPAEAAAHGGHEEHGGEHLHPAPQGFFRNYIWSYDHKVVAKQYLWTSLIFMILGGSLAMLLRWQIAYPFKPVPVIGGLLKNAFFFAPDGSVSA